MTEPIEAAAQLIEQRAGSIPDRQEIAAEIRALRPVASGDLRERIARIVGGIYGLGVGTFAGGHQDKSINRAVDAIASLPGLNEESIRSSERERCETIVATVKNRCLRESQNQDRPLVQQRVSSAQAFVASEIAAAIRSLKTESGS